MIEVEIEATGDVLEFPDGTDTDVIRSVAARVAKGRLSSAGNAAMQGGGVGVGQAVSGLARLGAALERSGLVVGPGGAIPVTQPDLVRERLRVRELPPEEQEKRIQETGLYQAGAALAEGAREAFQTNPKYRGELLADVLPGSAGQMVPTLALGMINPVLAGGQYGLSAGQGAAEEAIEAGRPELAQDAFLATAPIGALTEATLGAAGGIRMLREFAKARGAGAGLLRGSLREATQESLEQVGANLVASDVVGFDPDRPVLAGVPEAAIAGGLLGGAIGGLAGIGARPETDTPPPPAVDPTTDPDLDELPDADLVSPENDVPDLAPGIEPPAAQEPPVPPPASADVPETSFGNIHQGAEAQMPAGQQSEMAAEPQAEGEVAPASEIQAMQGPPEPSVIQLYGTRAIERLDTLAKELRANTYSDPLMLTTFARAAIDIARVLVRGGMALDQAIRQAVAQARQRMPDAPDDDTRLIESMGRNLLPRQFIEQVEADPGLSDVMRSQVTNRLYVRQPNEDSAAFAGRILEQAGTIEAGTAIFRDAGSGLDGASRTMLGSLILKRMAAAESEARTAGREAEADAMAQRQAAFIDSDLAAYSTDIAQALQAFAAFRFITPQATIAWARRQIDRGSRDARERFSPVVDGLVDQLNGINVAEVNNVAATEEVQAAAGTAIDAALEQESQQPTGTLADAIRIEATNNLDMLASVREAMQQARIRGLQNVAKVSGYWQRVVNTSSRQLERRIAQLLGPNQRGQAPAFTVADFASQLTSVLGEQLDAALGRQPSPGARTRPDYLAQLRQLLGNAERMSDIWAKVRDQIREQYPDSPQVAQVLAGTFDVWSDALLRRVIDQSLEAQQVTLRDMIRANYRLRQGALGERLVQDLGLDASVAARLVRAADDAYTAEVQRIQASVPQRAGRIRRDPLLLRALRTGMVEGVPASELDLALARMISERRIRLGRLVRRHYTEVDALGRSLEQRLVDDAGLTGPAAERLAAALRAQFEARTAAARRLEIQRIIASGVAVPRTVRQAWERIVEMANVGAVSERAAWDAMRDRLNLPQWTPELAQEVNQLADAIQRAPDGIPQQRAVNALLDALARANLRWWDFPIAFWYANVLSGPVTHVRNILGNTSNLVAESLVSLRRPMDWPSQMAAVARGLRYGVNEGIEIMRTGRITGARSLRAEAARPLELARLAGRWDYLLTPWRLVGRALAATDTVFFMAGYEARQQLLSRLVAKREGLSGTALDRRVAEIMGRTEERTAAARAQATAEGFSGRALERRVQDLVDRTRPEDMRQNAREYALRLTFNQAPYGLLGAIANGVNRMSADAPAIRLVVPFTNVIANVVNAGLDWFPPVGIGRAVYGHWRGRLHGREITNMEDLYDQHARAALGTVLMVALYTMAEAFRDDDDPVFAISAVGPKDSARRSQLRMQGWIPHSVKIGDTYYSYANTPLAMPFAVLGNWFDAMRYGKDLNTGDLFERTAYAVATTANVIVDQSFLDGVTRILAGLNRNDPKSSAKLFEQLGRTASSVVIPNAVRQIDRLFDPTVYDSPDITAALVQSVPFARRKGQPALNVWGEPVTITTLQSFVSRQEPDPILGLLARKGIWISTPSARTHVDGQPLTPDEVYEYTKVRGPRLRQFLSTPARIAVIQRLSPEATARVVDRLEEAAGRVGAQAVRQYRRRKTAER